MQSFSIAGVDPSGTDKNLQQIRSVEDAWDLPALPDEVKLDLAGRPDHTPEKLNGLLWGLHTDLNEAYTPPASVSSVNPAIHLATNPGIQDSSPSTPEVAPGTGALPGGANQATPTGSDGTLTADLRRVWAGITGAPAPTELSTSAVQQFKMKAVRSGVLPSDTPIDDTWRPELNNALYDQSLADYQRRIEGEHPGALSVHQLAGTMDKWLSPSGLISAATTMGFIPDFKSFGNKWADVAKDPGSPSKWFHALTGTVDKVVVPLVNDYLLVSGVGEVAMFSRGLALGKEAAAASELAYATKGARFLSGASVATDIDRFKEASFLSKQVGRASTGVGDAMQAWRELPTTLLGKKTTQQAMRLGFAGRVEDLFGSSEGGSGNNTIMARHPVFAQLGDLFLVAPHITRPGFYSEPAGALASRSKNTFIGLVTGDLSAAARGVTGQALIPPMPRVAQEATNAVHTLLSSAGGKTAESFERNLKEGGPVKALLEHHGFPDTPAGREAVGHWIATVSTAAALDLDASARTAVDLGGASAQYSDPKKWFDRYHLYRNKSIAQLREIDPEVPGWENEYARIKSTVDTSSNKQARKAFLDYKDRLTTDPTFRAQALEEVANHNAKRETFFRDTITALQPGAVQQYMETHAETIGGRWDEYVGVQDAVRKAVSDGLLDQAQFKPVFSESGRKLKIFPQGMDAAAEAQKAGVSLQDTHFNPLGAVVDPLGMPTVARADTVVKGDYRAQMDRVKRLTDAAETWRWVRDNPKRLKDFLQPLAEQAGTTPFHELSPAVAANWVQNLTDASGIPSGDTGRLAAFLRWTSRQGVDLGSVGDHITQTLNDVDNEASWAQQFKIATRFDEIPAKTVNQGPEAQMVWSLKQKHKLLGEKLPFVADEVDLNQPGLEALKSYLGDRQYKMVWGREFLMHHDVAFDTAPFMDLTDKTAKQLALSSFATRTNYQATSALQRNNLQKELASGLGGLKDEGRLLNPLNLGGEDNADLKSIVSRLDGILTEKRALGQAAQEGATTAVARLGNRVGHSRMPMSIFDLSFNDLSKEFGAEMGTPAVERIFGALRQAKVLGVEHQGLPALEYHMRANSQLVSGLNLFGRTESASRLRTAAKATAYGLAGAGTAEALGADPREALGAGVISALGGATVASRLVDATRKPILNSLEDKGWLHYTYLADNLAQTRDWVRFALNPMFDARRWAKGFVLSQMTEKPGDIALPARLSRRAFVASHGEQEWEKTATAFKSAARGDFGSLDDVTDIEHFFTQEGLLGYNPTNRMISAYGHLLKGGVEPGEAYNTVRKIYTYGTTGRSPLELSANFLFFPFSFDKKLVSTAGKFLSQDLSRAMVLHDSLKTYSMLNEKYNLNQMWKDHLPVLQDLQKLNAFAHGISPGQLGGVNRNLWDAAHAAMGSVSPVMNLFLPQAVNIKSSGEKQQLLDIAKGLIPATTETKFLLDDLKEQGHVVYGYASGGSGLTRQGEINRGWETWDKLRTGVDQVAKENGAEHGIQTVMRADRYAPLRDFVKQQRSKILDENPAWAASRAAGSARRSEDQQALEHMAYYPKNEAETAAVKYNELVQGVQDQLQQQGISLTEDPELVPEQYFTVMRGAALELAHQYSGFDVLYKRFFRRSFGPLEAQI